MPARYDIVFIGLSLSSSWGNGHATTYRALLKGLYKLGLRVLFLEREQPWYAAHRDLPEPDFCSLHYYRSVEDLQGIFGRDIAAADAVILGSYVPDGPAVADLLHGIAPGRTSFYDIDTPVTLAALTSGRHGSIAPHQIPRLQHYFSFSGGPILDRLRDEFGARNPVALYCSVDLGLYRNSGDATTWDLGYLGTYSADRQPSLERLLLEPARRLPDRRFVVCGAQYPDSIAWPRNVEKLEHLPPTAHAAFYSRQRFTLNLTRADMIAAGWSPSVRLFEAAACRIPVISDYWPGLESLLPIGDAVRTADNTEEVVHLLTTLPEDRRQAIGRSAYRRIRRAHSGDARARQLLDHLDIDLPETVPELAKAATSHLMGHP